MPPFFYDANGDGKISYALGGPVGHVIFMSLNQRQSPDPIYLLYSFLCYLHIIIHILSAIHILNSS